MRDRYERGRTFAAFLDGAEKNRELWRALYERAHVPDEYVERVHALGGSWHLLVLAEDWCTDAVSTLPWLQRLAERVANLDLRILRRDENPDLMKAHLTRDARSIPIVIILDETFQERGCWGPRPGELQEWVLDEGLALPREDRLRSVRRWYARDRGTTTLDEVVTRLEAIAHVAV